MGQYKKLVNQYYNMRRWLPPGG